MSSWKHRIVPVSAILVAGGLAACGGALEEQASGALDSVQEQVESRLGIDLPWGDDEGGSAVSAITASTRPDSGGVDADAIGREAAALVGEFFTFSGVEVDLDDYPTGGWTLWSVAGMRDVEQVERAYLGRADGGGQWWRIRLTDTNRPEDVDWATLEMRLSPPSADGSGVVYEVVADLPALAETVTVLNESGWSFAATDAIDEANVGEFADRAESIQVGAGVFYATVLMSTTEDVSWSTWVWDDVPLGREPVPGTIVRHHVAAGEQQVIFELLEYGGDAEALLTPGDPIRVTDTPIVMEPVDEGSGEGPAEDDDGADDGPEDEGDGESGDDPAPM